MKILITGGAGYIGSVLVDYLFEHIPDAEILVYDNLMYGQATSLFKAAGNKKFTFIPGDVRDFDKVRVLAKQADVVIPLACLVGAPLCNNNKKDAWDINFAHVTHLAEDTKAKIIIPTTNSGYGIGGNGECTEESPLNPLSVYGETKIAAEKFVLGIGGISLRLATVFGASPRQRLDLLVNDFVIKALRDKAIVLFEGHFRRNYIHVKDVCKAFLFCIQNYDKMSGQAYNVGLSTANLTKRQLAEKVKEHLPDTVIIESEFGSDPDKRDYLVSNAKLESLGWSPDYTIDDGIEEIIKCYHMIKTAGDSYRNY